MRLSACGLSDIGLCRKNNEDSFVVNPSLGLFAVCDGLGGHEAGEVASSTVANALESYLSSNQEILQTARRNNDVAAVAKIAMAATEYASAQLTLTSKILNARKMGTTLTFLIAVDQHAVISHVGDSRAYRIRHGAVQLLTHDDTYSNELVKLGLLSELEAKSSPHRHLLTRCVTPNQPIETETFSVEMKAGDYFLLCTDGVSGAFDAHESITDCVASALSNKRCVSNVPRMLIDHANACGGKDNATAVIIRVDKPIKNIAYRLNWKLKARSLNRLEFSC